MAAADARTGICLPWHRAGAVAWEVPGMVHVAVPAEPVNAWQGVSGAVAWRDAGQACEAAIAEALERYAAARAALPVRRRADLGGETVWHEDRFALYSPTQRAQPDFPWPMAEHEDDGFSPVWRMHDNQLVWVPQELVGLGVREGQPRMPSTSSGLAAQKDAAGAAPWRALLRATQEILERDALAVSWLNGLGGREFPLPAHHADVVAALGAEVVALDLTQVWNPHPVIAVMGRHQAQGQTRHAFGIACRHTTDDALDKAWLEWAQSLRFADHLARHGSVPADPRALRRFDEHAAYYTCHPQGWAQLPLLHHRTTSEAPPRRADPTGPPPSDVVQLQILVERLLAEGVELAYRELTPPDVAQAGLRVVRVLSPQLSLLHADERAPFLGGRAGDWGWRYPQALAHHPLSNPWPHPLG
jgi:ribosomal protein S12 methylthiotransferase accessory factor